MRYYQGLEGIKAVLDETLACRSKTLLGILSMSDLYEVPGPRLDGRQCAPPDRGRREPARGALATKDVHPFWADDPADLRVLRYAPDDFSFSMTTYIYDDTVALISSRKENFAMTIESEEFAAMQTGLFETLWAVARPAAAGSKRPGRGKIIDLHSQEMTNFSLEQSYVAELPTLQSRCLPYLVGVSR